MAHAKKSEDKDLQAEIDKSAKLFDVAQPGKTAAPTTSRPVIVGHTTMTKHDPMVVKSDDKTDDTPKTMTHSKPRTVAVPVSHEKEAEPEEPTPELEEKTIEEPPKEDAKPEAPAAAVVDSLANEVTAKQTEKKEKKDQELQTEEAEKLIASKQFFVPIGQESRRRSSHRLFFILLLVILLGLVGLNLAIDAEVIDIGVNSLTNIL